jgi:protein-disulfide isomerase
MKKLAGILLAGLLLSISSSSVFAATKQGGINSLYEPAGNAIAGNPKGHITVVEFFDYNCGYCRMIYPKFTQLIKTDPNLRVIYREYPVLSERSILPAKAALAAEKQGKYEALHHAMMNAMMPLNQNEIVKLAKPLGIDTDKLVSDMQSPAIDQQVNANLALGQAMNIQGVPAFIVVRTTPPSKQEAKVVIGPTIDELKNLIQQANQA